MKEADIRGACGIRPGTSKHIRFTAGSYRLIGARSGLSYFLIGQSPSVRYENGGRVGSTALDLLRDIEVVCSAGELKVDKYVDLMDSVTGHLDIDPQRPGNNVMTDVLDDCLVIRRQDGDFLDDARQEVAWYKQC